MKRYLKEEYKNIVFEGKADIAIKWLTLIGSSLGLVDIAYELFNKLFKSKKKTDEIDDEELIGFNRNVLDRAVEREPKAILAAREFNKAIENLVRSGVIQNAEDLIKIYAKEEENE